MTDLTATVSLSGITDFRYDDASGLLYLTTSAGTLERWSPTTGFGASIVVGGSPTAIDLTPDGAYALIAGPGPYAQNIERVNLSTLAVEQLNLAPSGGGFMEGTSFDVVVMADGKALASTRINGSGWTPVREFDASSATIAPSEIGGGAIGAAFSAPAYLIASDNHRYVLVEEGNISNAPVELFDSVADCVIGGTNLYALGSSGFNDGHGSVSDSGLVYWAGEVFDSHFNVVQDLRSLGSVTSSQFSSDSQYLFLWTTPGVIEVFQTSNWQQIANLAVAISPGSPHMELSDDGHFLFIANGSQFEAIDLTARFTSSPASNIVDASGGDQVLTGAGWNTVSYANAAAGVTVSLALQGQPQDTHGAGVDTLSGFPNLIGSAFNDTLEGDGGDNALDGRAGTNTVSYGHAASGVSVSLELEGSFQDTIGAGNDTLSNFQNLTGSTFNDTLEGDGNNNALDGGAGTNTVSFAHATSAVTVSLALQGSAQDTHGAGSDTLSNFQNIIGSAFDDHLTGDANDNIIDGGPGGNDTLDGGAGNNTASYASARTGQAVSLSLQGQAQYTGGGWGADTLYNFQNLIGSAYDDTLTGDSQDNVFTGGLGQDLFVLTASNGHDTITDFTSGEDRVDLLHVSSLASYADVLSHAVQAGADVVISWGQDSLTLQHATLASLTANDFVLTQNVATIDITDTYTIAAGESLSFDGGSNSFFAAYQIQYLNGAPSQYVWFDDYGSIQVTTSQAGAQIEGVFDNASSGSHYSEIYVAAGATLSVATTAASTTAYGYAGGAAAFAYFGNDGLFTVSAVQQAVGAYLFGGGQVSNTGQFIVAADTATGIFAEAPAYITNSGSLTVTGHAQATAIEVAGPTNYAPNQLRNSGTITATTDDGVSSVGIEVTGDYTSGDYNYYIGNGGTITAATAIRVAPASTSGSPLIQLVNWGTINGNIVLGVGPVVALPPPYDSAGDIQNSGAIHGDIHLTANGENSYDGSGGTLTGAIYLGGGRDFVQLGDDGETAYGGTGDARIRGGAGDDHIYAGSGNALLDGGGGTNTVSYAHAASGVTVSLAMQGQAQNTVGAGTDTLSNFQILTGSAFNDTLEGDANNNVLDGGAGTNTVSYAHAASGVTVSLALQGQAQNTVGAGTDTLSNFQNLTGSVFNDTLEGDANSNVLDGGAGTNTVSYAHAMSGVTVSLALQGSVQNTVGAGTDTLSNFQNLTGSAFADHLTGDANNNVIDGGGGNDVLDGGGGTNTLSFASATGGVAVSLALQGQAQNTGVGSITAANFQNLTGSAFNDTLEGDGNNNVLDGGAGTNTVSYAHSASGVTVSLGLQGQAQNTGGAGTDTLSNFLNLTGSAFNDVLEGDGNNNVLDGGAGTNTVSYAHAASGVTVSLALQGSAQNTAGAGTDTLTNFQNLTGSAFNDTLEGGGDNNVLDGGAGTNTVSYAHATSGVTVSLGLQGQAQNTVGAGADTLSNFQNLTGSAFNDVLEGDGNNNVLDGGAGTNTVSYAHAASAVTVSLALQGSAQDTIGAGTDTLSNFRSLTGSAFNDTLEGDGNNNVLDGGAGTNSVSYAHAASGVTVSLGLQGQAQNTVGAGSDTLSNFQRLTGSAYGDILEGGGFASTTLTGGLSADTFVYRAGDGAVTITDFSDAQGDKIDLRRLGGLTALSQLMAIATQSGADTVINFGGGDTLTLKNVTMASLTASDFLLSATGPIQVGNTTVVVEPAVSLTVTSGPLVQFTDPAGGMLINKGSLTLNVSTYPGTAGVVTAVQPEPNAVFENDGTFTVNSAFGMGVSSATVHNYGTFSVSGGIAGGEGATGDFVNYGMVTVQGSTTPSDVVYGDYDSSGHLFQNQAGATFSTSAQGNGIGVDLVNGGQFTNAGALTVSATGNADGAYISVGSLATTIVNSGTITATGATSTGIAIVANSSTTAISIQNAGTITAQTAISFVGLNSVTFTNSGTLNGDLALSNGNDQVVNTGTINGAVSLGSGVNTLDSHLGTITGAIALRSDISTITLGADNNTVTVNSGTHVLDGGGGNNTISYQPAASGVTVSLAFQGQAQATGVSTDTLTNFQTLVGSLWNDTLTASAGTSTLTGIFGADTFKLVSGGAHTTITDFKHSDGDKIDLSALPQFTSLSTVMAAAGQLGPNTIITTGSGSLTLDLVNMSSLTASDFIFAPAGGGGTPGHGLQINVSYDASANAAPAGFKTAVQAAVNFFETAFAGANVTVNISFGWGAMGSTPVDSGAVAENLTYYDVGLSYQSVRNALIAADADDPTVAAAAAALPVNSLVGSAPFAITSAEAKVLGLSPASSLIDGHVGLSAADAFTFDPNNRTVGGAYDAIGAFEHEISEVLGRVVNAGRLGDYGVLDLFRYTAPNVHTYSPGASYFSLDGGATNLKAFNNGAVNTGDDGDWATSSTVDAFDAFGGTGVQTNVSAVDLQAMEVLGYGPATTAPGGGPAVGPGIGGAPTTGSGTLNGTSGNDWLQGQGANDTLHGGAGSDYLDGGAGLNTALYDGAYRQYTVGSAGAWVSGGPEGGADELVNIQRIQFADGYLAVSPTDTAGQVYRLYEATLGRAPDQEGLTNWVHGLNGGTSLQSVVDGFVGSTEFQQHYGALSNADFVTLLYNNVLHRDPDASGLANWAGDLAGGMTRAQVVLGFSESPEDINDLAAPVQQGLWIADAAAGEVARLYDAVLGRLPDGSGLANWTHSLESGASLQSVANGFVGSQEFQSVYGQLNNSQFVTQLYHNVLHRDPDAAGLANWVGDLTGGMTRAQVVIGFSESPEHIGNMAPYIDGGVWLAG